MTDVVIGSAFCAGLRGGVASQRHFVTEARNSSRRPLRVRRVDNNDAERIGKSYLQYCLLEYSRRGFNFKVVGEF